MRKAAGRTTVATAVTSQTTTVAAIQEPIPLMLIPLENSEARNSAAKVDTSPIPPRKAEA